MNIFLIQVAKSRDFRRDGADVHSDVNISLSQAVLGGAVRIPGIYGETLLNVSLVMLTPWVLSYSN